MNFEFKRDKYKDVRGAHSRLLNLYCWVCGNKIAIYQKDGSGSLMRIYMDRILYPKKLTGLESKPLDQIHILQCPKCKEELGVPYIYREENRKAFRLYQDALIKKIRKLKDD
ncbi:hypothetical protein GQ472_03195 [archaeon]|nr:hypothetical protein [archaeon]